MEELYARREGKIDEHGEREYRIVYRVDAITPDNAELFPKKGDPYTCHDEIDIRAISRCLYYTRGKNGFYFTCVYSTKPLPANFFVPGEGNVHIVYIDREPDIYPDVC